MSALTVSVIIPTYNRAHLIERAIKSALSETNENDEIIIINDGSTDNTEEVVKPFLNHRVHYKKVINGGAGMARNHGLKMVTKDLVAFLDSDDEWYEGKLNMQRALMEARPDILFCFSDISITSSKGEIVHNFLQYWHNDKRSWDEILGPGKYYSEFCELPSTFKDFKIHCGDIYVDTAFAIYTVTSTTVVRRKEAGEALIFSFDTRIYEDWTCFGLLAKKGTAAYLDVETAWQHSHDSFRVTDADSYTTSSSRIIILENLWKKDAEFMEEHGERFYALIEKMRLIKVSSLIALGRTAEAKEEMKLLKTIPTTHKFLANLPGPCARGIILLRRSIRKMLGQD